VRFSVRQTIRVQTGKHKSWLYRLLDTDHTHLLSLTQTSLEGVVTREPRMPAFTNAGLLDYIIELVICEDKVSVV
jgi:hypothetical protein